VQHAIVITAIHAFQPQNYLYTNNLADLFCCQGKAARIGGVIAHWDAVKDSMRDDVCIIAISQGMNAPARKNSVKGCPFHRRSFSKSAVKRAANFDRL
jgi:hypothetical protein